MRLGRTRFILGVLVLGLFTLSSQAITFVDHDRFIVVEPDRRRGDTEPEKLQESLRKIVAGIAAATVRVETFDGMGSGTIIDMQGHIVTSAHVVEGGRKVTVTLADGRRFIAKVLGINSAGDLALLDIDADHLKPAVVGNSDTLHKQQWVVAAGHPVSAFDDFQPTISVGLISRVNAIIRADRKKVFYGTIVSDTPLSPGSSGGGLFDLKGRLVAINAAVTQSEMGAFSVRINEFLKDKKRLLRGEHFDRLASPVTLSRAERNRTSRTRTQYFSANFESLQSLLAKRQVRLRHARKRLTGIIVSASGDVLVPAMPFTHDTPGTLISFDFDGQRNKGEVARLIAVDRTVGVAMLRLPERDEPYAFFDLSKDVVARRGQLAIARKRRWTLTGGIVGATKRIPPLTMTNFVYFPNVTQVDLRLKHSDRGAGIVNVDGDLLGMVIQPRLEENNDSGAPDPYGAFLLPLALLRESYCVLEHGHGRGARPVGFLGVELQDMTETQKVRYNINRGVRVADAVRGYPAFAAGIRRGDIITSIGGVNVNSRGTASSRIASLKSGDEVVVAVKRRSGMRSFRVVLIDRAELP